MNKKDSNKPAPYESGPDARPRPREQSAEDCWDQEAEGDPQREKCARNQREAFGSDSSLGCSDQGREVQDRRASRYGVPDSSQHTEDAPTMAVGRMRIAGHIGVLVVASVYADPPEERALDCHRPENR
jgi:hypothetical protein